MTDINRLGVLASRVRARLAAYMRDAVLPWAAPGVVDLSGFTCGEIAMLEHQIEQLESRIRELEARND